MKKELEIWQFAAEKLKHDESVMLLVVAESAGSSPGRQGFKMIVARDDLAGSIGGGVMEVRLAEQAKFKVQSSKFKVQTEIVEQNHKKNSPDASGMICSGKQTIVFYKLNFEDLETVHGIISALENYQSKVLQISKSKFQIAANSAEEFNFQFQRLNEKEFFYTEKLGFKNKLSIIGGGHCALALSELMSKMDFHISLFDNRPHLNTLAENKFAHAKTIVESYEKIDEFVSSGANDYIVVMTLGYKTDEVAIEKLLGKNFKYFGVLGSKAKMKNLLRSLEKKGFAKEKLNQIRAPIGLPINSQTPEEIAVSIAAEIIAVKNAR